MPPIRYYTVTQTREVRVSSSDPITAVLVANKAFENQNSDESAGSIQSDIRIIEVIIREDI